MTPRYNLDLRGLLMRQSQRTLLERLYFLANRMIFFTFPKSAMKLSERVAFTGLLLQLLWCWQVELLYVLPVFAEAVDEQIPSMVPARTIPFTEVCKSLDDRWSTWEFGVTFVNHVSLKVIQDGILSIRKLLIL